MVPSSNPPMERWQQAGSAPAPVDRAVPTPRRSSGSEEPGQRSGEGADSLQTHLRNDARRQTDPASRNQNGVERSEHRVLVVDDNPAMRYATARGLRAAGFNTVEAAAGAEGLALSKTASAVVLDINLPDLDGLEVCRLVRADPATALLPVVHVTAVSVEEADQAASREAGADAYLVGPVPPSQLAELVDRLISESDFDGPL